MFVDISKWKLCVIWIFLFLLQVCDWTSGRRNVGFMLCDSVFCHLSQVMESSDDDPAYVVKFKSTFRTDLETRKQNANIVYVKTAAGARFKELKCLPRSYWTHCRNRGLLEGNLWKQQHPSHQRRSWPCWCFIRVWTGGRLSWEQCGGYRAEPTISTEACPLECCSNMQHMYLATAATSVPVKASSLLLLILCRRREFLYHQKMSMSLWVLAAGSVQRRKNMSVRGR